MNILGIETSCDETAASVVRDGKDILSNIVVSSLKEHEQYGGVIPEIASRRQLEYINPIVEEALLKSRLGLEDIDAIAVTQNPGLIGSLLVGTSFAKALSFSLNKPLIEVDHIKAHIYANFLNAVNQPTLPAVGLVVSGGHTILYRIKDIHHFLALGQTLDDAVGEAFDKVARVLGLGYPGGPIIDRLAQEVEKSSLKFKCADLPDSFDFSFSGIKTAILYYVRDHKYDKDFSIKEVACAFQESVVSVLIEKSIHACQKFKIKTLLVGGGVAANSHLRKRLILKARGHHIKVYFPTLPLCLDNAAMIAGLGYHIYHKKMESAGKQFCALK